MKNFLSGALTVVCILFGVIIYFTLFSGGALASVLDDIRPGTSVTIATPVMGTAAATPPPTTEPTPMPVNTQAPVVEQVIVVATPTPLPPVPPPPHIEWYVKDGYVIYGDYESLPEFGPYSVAQQETCFQATIRGDMFNFPEAQNKICWENVIQREQ